ncbi:hypothetical protein [Neptuniibacter sp. QD37_11]|uniref:hypothetical protein n=1 Tax=Neptuniibacter sp. QD37_11 TaxID=3398209 RepID=UPI0039F5A12A
MRLSDLKYACFNSPERESWILWKKDISETEFCGAACALAALSSIFLYIGMIGCAIVPLLAIASIVLSSYILLKDREECLEFLDKDPVINIVLMGALAVTAIPFLIMVTLINKSYQLACFIRWSVS